MKYNLFFFCLILCFVSCKTKIDDSPRASGTEYCANKTGSWIIYKVDSIVFDDFHAPLQGVDSFHYQVKEVITEKFLNTAGKETNRIERYKRNADSLPWVITNVWTSNITSSSFEKVEENIRYVKMSFPISENKFWNGNLLNILEPNDYSFKSIKSQAVVNGFTFNNTVTVLQIDSANDNFIEKRFAKEIYAENIGMIYKQIDTIEIQNNIKSGLYFRQTIIDWSK